MRIYFALTAASLKMYFRNRTALFWALFFPLLVMIIFGIMNFDGYNSPDVGVYDAAENEASRSLITALRGPADEVLLNLSVDTLNNVQRDLKYGNYTAVIEIPANYGNRDEYAEIKGQGQGFKAWLIPGIAAMAIMQTGLFTVVFSLVRFKSQGVLRRMKATPIGASHFLAGQLTTKAIVVVLQTYVLVLSGALVLGVTIGTVRLGAWLDLTILALLGGALFIAIGLAVSGWAKNEETAAPIANVISLPMMFLSGIFFPQSIMPDWMTQWTQYLPLAFLADGMRAITVEGASITTLGSELLGLGLWTLTSFAIATKMFRWE